MKLPKLPALLRVKLESLEARVEVARAALQECVSDEAKALARAEIDDAIKALDESPLFTYAPLTHADVGDVLESIRENGRERTRIRVFRERIRDISTKDGPLFVEDEKFDHRNDAHIEALPPEWAVDIGWRIVNRARLSEQDAGK